MKQETDRLPLRERNRQRVMQRILSATFALFREAGYTQTTMDAIAEKAEVSRGTLFNYFPTKGALLIPFMKELYVEHVQPEVIPYLRTKPTTLQALRFLFMSIYEHILLFPDINQAFQQELFCAQPAETDINRGTGFLDNVEAILAYGQQRGEVRTDIPIEKLVRYVGVLYISLFPDIVGQHTPTKYADEVDTLLAFMGRALR